MKLFLIVVPLLLPMVALACPGCYDMVNSNNTKAPPYTFIILGTFILLAYIPFYILFRAAKKYDPEKLNGND